jgi:DNA polymerase III subunit epsilon
VFSRLRRSDAKIGKALPRPSACDFVALDFETANEKRGSACAIGVALVRNGQVIAESSTLINPETYFNPYCTAVNGITEDDVRAAPTLPQLWPELSELLDGQLVVAHNASFDIAVLRNMAARYGLTGGPSFDVLCTYRMARVAWPNIPSYSLGFLASRLQIVFNHHEAGDDARACAFVALAICHQLGIGGLGEAASALLFLPGRITPDSYHPFQLESLLRTTDGRIDADAHHPLYGKSICFTGTLNSMVRHDAMERVTEVGCDFKTSVSKQLDYLVVGDGDFVRFADGWQTGKLAKAVTLQEAGAPIEIIPEKDFLHFLLAGVQA